MENYHIIELVGEGSFGKVRKLVPRANLVLLWVGAEGPKLAIDLC
jgi:hypothetical protein